jgi:integrase
MAGGKLTARAAAATKPGRYGDGAGLYLIVSPSGARKWVYRFTWRGKVTEMGLGSADVASLAEARRLRDEARKVLAGGANPIEARRETKRARDGRVTFGALADELLKDKRPEWRNQKHAEQWRWSLEVAAAPLRGKFVDEIGVEDVLAVLKALWVERQETATRLRQRIGAVLSAAKAKGLRSGENPAAWRGHLEHLLPKRQRLAKGHHAAMDYRELPAFMEKLRSCEVIGGRALEFCILTAARSGEIFGARWSEINMASKVWTVPPHRMKSGREHRVPLSGRALEILEGLAKGKTGEFVFPSPRGDRPLSHVAMQKVLARLGVTSATVHGMRSAFRDWAGHETTFPREIAEQALAHRLGDAAELAYKRGDFLEKRRELMAAWAAHCEPGKADNVVSFRKSGGDAA